MDDIWLPDFLNAQPLGSAVLWSCLAEQLPWQAGEAKFTIEFKGIWSDEPTRPLRLRWDAGVLRLSPGGAPNRTVTELAACAVALILSTTLLQAPAQTVAEVGERFDYWLRGDEGWYGLEVSGTQSVERSELQQRYREKRRQLLSNTQGLNGYVVIVGFATRQIIVSGHNFGEDENE